MTSDSKNHIITIPLVAKLEKVRTKKYIEELNFRIARKKVITQFEWIAGNIRKEMNMLIILKNNSKMLKNVLRVLNITTAVN